MNKDDNNEDEEKDDFLDDNEDFGLPNLDYEELDEDDESEELSTEEESIIEEDLAFEMEDSSNEETSEDYGDISDEDMDSILDDEISETDYDLSDIDDEISDSSFNEEEFSKFENELIDSEEENINMGLNDKEDNTRRKSKGKFVRIVIIGIFVIASIGAALLYFSPDFKNKVIGNKIADKKPKVKVPVKQKPVIKKDTVTTKVPKKSEPKPKVIEPIKTVPGTITSFSARTNNYYIIIGSFIDRDIAMDYAKKISSKGKSVSIIPPFRRAIYHRVAISGYKSLSDAENVLAKFRTEYTQDVWVLKY